MDPEEKPKKVQQNIENIEVIPRSQWGAVEPKSVETQNADATYMVATWTGTDRCNTLEECSARIRDIQNANMNDEGLPDIKYNFLIGHDRNVYEGRGWKVNSNVSEGENGNLKQYDEKSIYVAFIGPKDSLPYPHMLQTLAGLCHIGVTKGFMTRNIKYIRVHKGKAEIHNNVFEENPDIFGLPGREKITEHDQKQ